MTISEFAVRRPVTISMLILGLVIAGLAGLFLMRIDALPDIEPPVISVITVYPGATALDIESEVTERLEDKLSSVNNLDTMTSKSKDNVSIITLKFDWEVNLDEASNDIRDKIDLVRKDLPEDVEDPILFKFNSSDFPIIVAGVSAKESYRDLYRIVDKQIVDPLRRVPGVGEVDTRGGLRREINVHVDRNQLEQLNISPAYVEGVLARENLNVPAGDIKRGFTELKVRVPGRYKTIEDIRSVVVGVFKGSVITLGDIAEVKDAFEELEEMVWSGGQKAVILVIRKQSGRNTPEVCARVKDALEELQKRLPGDVRINIIIDTSESILNSIRNLRGSMIAGGVLVILITWLFLLRLRSSLIIGVTIPVCLISVFFGMFILGYTVNMVSLVSLTIAVGMVVDNAIVVLENITRHMSVEKDAKEAAITGAREVVTAIFASMLTTVVVFLPLVFTTGITGIVFKQLAVIVSVTVALSWFISVTLTPMMASQLLRSGHQPETRGFFGRVNAVILGWFKGVEDAYAGLLHAALHHRPITIIIAVVVFVSSLPLLKFIGTEFAPEVDSGEVSINIEYDENTRLEETARIAEPLIEYFEKNVPEKRNSYLIVGESPERAAMGMREGPNIGQGGAKLTTPEHRKRSSKEIANALRAFLSKQPGIERLSVSALSFMQKIFFSTGSGKPVSVEIQGPDLEALSSFSDQLKHMMKQIPGLMDVTITRPENRRELWVEIDRARAAVLGVTVASLSKTVRTLFYGVEATEYFDAGDDFDIFLRLPDRQRVTKDDILNVTLPSILPDAPPIKLANVARVEERFGPLEIERKNRERIVRVEADVFKRSAGEVVADIRTALSSMDTPPGVEITFGGDTEEQAKAFKTLLVLLLIGILLVYMVMAGQFESLIHPFVIMFSVPFAATGAIWALFLTGNRLNLMSFIGVIMLVGIVVNNAIVLLHYTHQLRMKGMELFSAVRQACSTRLRPVLMTTLTTAFALVPMVLSRREGAEAWRPMGTAIIGGLLVAMLVTLVLVPVMYTLFEGKRDRLGQGGDSIDKKR